MTTLGDVLHSAIQFFSLKKTQQLLPQKVNPATSDAPLGGQYHNYPNWEDMRKERLALTTSWVYAAINKISLAALPAKLEIHRRIVEDTEPIVNHPLELLFQTPNAFMSREYLWRFYHFSMQLSGKAYWFLYPDMQGNIAELWPVPHHKLVAVPDASSNPSALFSHYIYKFSSGQEMTVPSENVVYSRFPDPFDLHGAWAPLKAGSLAMVLDRAQAAWNTKTFDAKSGLPTSIISVAPETSTADFDILKEDLRRHHGENMTIRGGALEVQRLAMNNEEAQYLESRVFNRNEIYEVFGIPTGDTASGVAIKEQDRLFINRTIWPLLEYVAGQITSQLCVPFFGPDIFATFSDIRPQDRSLAVQEAVQYWPSFSINETRQERGKSDFPPLTVDLNGEPVNIWDEIPSRFVENFVPTTTTPGTNADDGFQGQPSLQDAASPAASQVQENEQSLNIDNEAEDVENVEKKRSFDRWQQIAITRLKSGKSPGTPFFKIKISETDRYTLATVLGMCHSVAQIKAVFEHRDAYTVEAIKLVLGERDTVSPEQIDLGDDFAEVIQPFLESEVTRIRDQVGISNEQPDNEFWKKEQALLLALLIPFLEKWAEASISNQATLLSGVGLGIDANVNARATAWAGRYAADLSKSLTKTTRELAKAKIKNWMATGQPLSVLEGELGKVISPQWRARLIARTEVTRAYAEATLEVAEELGIDRVMWKTHPELSATGPCPVCEPLDGVFVQPGETFPGGFSSPPAHPFCVCEVLLDV